MKVVVFGAGGKTGSLVVERALAEGHTVTVFMHDGAAPERPGVRVAKGDAGDAAAVRSALAGQDAVIDAIGGKTPYKDTELEWTAARNIVNGMQAEGVRRLIVVSMMGLGESREQAPFWYEHLLMPTFLRGSIKDKKAMEAEVGASGVEFVIVRPPLLTDDAATGSITVLERGEAGHKVTRADLAQFMVGQLASDAYVGKAVVVVNS